ncbi:MAG: response regulator [Chloroflexi bacterium]|nr:response regulator [Chloroflexota bacterium]
METPTDSEGTTPRQVRILVVDDEPLLRQVLGRTLTMDGHQVTAVASAEEAIESLASAPYDLVISDLGLGEGQNGWDLASHVQNSYPGICIGLVTGWGSQIDPAQTSERGVVAILSKPCRLADLRALIAHCRELLSENQ